MQMVVPIGSQIGAISSSDPHLMGLRVHLEGADNEFYYAHLSRFLVQTGQEVRRGEQVGTVGSSGRVTAPHLHYEVRLGGAPVNPYRYLAKAGLYQQALQKDFPF